MEWRQCLCSSSHRTLSALPRPARGCVLHCRAQKFGGEIAELLEQRHQHRWSTILDTEWTACHSLQPASARTRYRGFVAPENTRVLILADLLSCVHTQVTILFPAEA